jgi:hypothetical protein
VGDGVSYPEGELPPGCELDDSAPSGGSEPQPKRVLCSIDALLALSPSQQLQYVEGIVDQLQPADYLAISLFQDDDRGNPLVELLGLPPVVSSPRHIALERRYEYSSFPVDPDNPNSDLPPIGESIDDGVSYVDDWDEIDFVVVQEGTTVEAVVTNSLDRDAPPLGTLARKMPLERGRHSLFVDYQTILDKTAGSAASQPKPGSEPSFFIKLIVASAAGVTQNIYYPATVATRREGRRLGEIVVRALRHTHPPGGRLCTGCPFSARGRRRAYRESGCRPFQPPCGSGHRHGTRPDP